MAKEVFVEDGEGEEGAEGGGFMNTEGMEEGDILKELHKRCAYLEKLNKVRFDWFHLLCEKVLAVI